MTKREIETRLLALEKRLDEWEAKERPAPEFAGLPESAWDSRRWPAPIAPEQGERFKRAFARGVERAGTSVPSVRCID